MVSSKTLALIIFSFAVMGVVVSQTLNTCGTVGTTTKPTSSSQCNDDKTLASGAKCCYVSTSLMGVSTTYCSLLAAGSNTAAIENAVKLTGATYSISCNSSYLAFTLLSALLSIFLF